MTDELKAILKDVFETHKDVEKVYVTDDEQVFIDRCYAEDHSRKSKFKGVKTVSRTLEFDKEESTKSTPASSNTNEVEFTSKDDVRDYIERNPAIEKYNYFVMKGAVELLELKPENMKKESLIQALKDYQTLISNSENPE